MYVFFLRQSAICGLVSGAIAQFLASPADLVKVQMQAKRQEKWNNRQARLSIL